MNDKTLNQIDQWAAQISHAVSKAAPVVWQTAVAVKRLDSIGALVTLFLGLVIAVALSRWLWIICQAYWGKLREESRHSTDDGNQAVAIISGVFSVFCGFGAVCIVVFGLLNQWLWIGAFYPQIAVAHDIIQRITRL